VKLKNVDEELFANDKEDNNDLQFSESKRPPSKQRSGVKSRIVNDPTVVSKENQQLKMENQRLQSMCNQLTNLVKSLTFAQKMQRAISPTSKVAPRSSSSRKNIQRLNSLKSQTKKSTTDASPNARKTKHSNSYSFSNSALDKKVTFKEESDPRNSEVHITAEGLKVIDFHPDEDPCLMNKELKDYERENRHRYVPRILTKKNQLMQDKIDKDIE
jgi:hypothetical protein